MEPCPKCGSSVYYLAWYTGGRRQVRQVRAICWDCYADRGEVQQNAYTVGEANRTQYRVERKNIS